VFIESVLAPHLAIANEMRYCAQLARLADRAVPILRGLARRLVAGPQGRTEASAILVTGSLSRGPKPDGHLAAGRSSSCPRQRHIAGVKQDGRRCLCRWA
jgi:hypothetical protein